MDIEQRKTGLECLGNVSWGQHVCVFYETREDLLGIVLPFLKAGLQGNELCVWVLSEGLTVNDALIELNKEISGIDEFILNGQLKIIKNKYLYGEEGSFDPAQVIEFWQKEESKALSRGFEGLRISGSGNFVKNGKWQALCDYERDVNKMISMKRILAICTYSFSIAGLPEILAIGVHHSVIVAKKEDKYTAFEPAALDSIIEHFNTGEQ